MPELPLHAGVGQVGVQQVRQCVERNGGGTGLNHLCIKHQVSQWSREKHQPGQAVEKMQHGIGITQTLRQLEPLAQKGVVHPKNLSKFYSGKKKKYTLKVQVIYHPNSKQIIGLDISNGSQHDIKLARKTVKKFKHCEYVMTDLGYYGLEQDGFKLLMPIKKKKNLPLFDVEKKYNKMIGKIRVVIEHINSQLKTFRILSERYRNRRKRFGLRINLIAALVNRINLQ